MIQRAGRYRGHQAYWRLKWVVRNPGGTLQPPQAIGYTWRGGYAAPGTWDSVIGRLRQCARGFHTIAVRGSRAGTAVDRTWTWHPGGWGAEQEELWLVKVAVQGPKGRDDSKEVWRHMQLVRRVPLLWGVWIRRYGPDYGWAARGAAQWRAK